MYIQKSHTEQKMKTKPEVIPGFPLGIYLDVLCASLPGQKGKPKINPTTNGEMVYLETLLINGKRERH